MKSKLLMKSAFCVLLLGMTLSLTGCPGGSTIVFFKDANLEKAVRFALGQPLGFLTDTALLDLRELTAKDLGITDLTGLDQCPNLTYLDLEGNAISDLRPLANLTSLMSLNLNSNQVLDLTPLAGLINLDTLALFNNPAVDIQALVTNAVNGGLGPGDQVVLDKDQMGDRALNVDIPDLQARGVNVVLVVPTSN